MIGLVVLGAVGGAFVNRVRGGLFPLGGNLPGRLAWAAFCGLLTLKAGWGCLAVAAAAYVGTLFGQFGALDMGRRSGMAPGQVVMRITAYGLLRAVPVAAVLWLLGLHWQPTAFVGGLAALAYEAPWAFPDWMLRVKGFGRGSTEDGADPGPPGRDRAEWGEVLHGAALGLALALA